MVSWNLFLLVFYYIDKTGMIEEMLQNRSEVNLFTRPRRFGKSLNMSMLKTFFIIKYGIACYKKNCKVVLG